MGDLRHDLRVDRVDADIAYQWGNDILYLVAAMSARASWSRWKSMPANP